jgi:Fe-S-cluster-containing dehydrogenase component
MVRELHPCAGAEGVMRHKPVPPTRRETLMLVATTAAGVSVARVVQADQPEPEPASVPQRPRKLGMVIDLDRCSRCRACVVACASENNVPSAGPEQAASSRPMHWMDMLVAGPAGDGVGLGASDVPIPCMHCENPACVKVCPVGATYLADDGSVAQIWDRCIGCRSCMVSCPYSRRYYNWSAPAWSGSRANLANPDVAVRPAGVVEKCTFCAHRVQATVEKARVDEEPLTDAALRLLPACAEACPTRAITFGDLADPTSTVAKLADGPRAMQLLAHLGTGPKVFYLRGRR